MSRIKLFHVKRHTHFNYLTTHLYAYLKKIVHSLNSFLKLDWYVEYNIIINVKRKFPLRTFWSLLFPGIEHIISVSDLSTIWKHSFGWYGCGKCMNIPQCSPSIQSAPRRCLRHSFMKINLPTTVNTYDSPIHTPAAITCVNDLPYSLPSLLLKHIETPMEYWQTAGPLSGPPVGPVVC
jgi:hypothetical protein